MSDRESGGELACLRGHQAGVDALVWSPDGQVLASGSEDKTVRLWDRGSARELPILRGHEERVQEQPFRWSPDGELLQTDGFPPGWPNSTKEIVWDTVTGRRLYSGSELDNDFAFHFEDGDYGESSHDDIFTRNDGEAIFLQAKSRPPIAWFPVGITLETVDGRTWAGSSGSEVYLLRLEGTIPLAVGLVYDFATLRPTMAERLQGKRALFRIKLDLDSCCKPEEDDGVGYDCEGEDDEDEDYVGRSVTLPNEPDEGVDVLTVEAGA